MSRLSADIEPNAVSNERTSGKWEWLTTDLYRTRVGTAVERWSQ